MDLSRICWTPSRSAKATSKGASRDGTASVEDAAKGATISADNATEKQRIEQFIIAVATATIFARTASEEQQSSTAAACLPPKLAAHARDVQ